MGLFGNIFGKSMTLNEYHEAQKRINELSKEIGNIMEKLSVYKHSDTSREKGKLVNTLADLRLERERLYKLVIKFEREFPRK